MKQINILMTLSYQYKVHVCQMSVTKLLQTQTADICAALTSHELSKDQTCNANMNMS